MDTPASSKDQRLKQYDRLFKTGLGTVAAVIMLISGADKVKKMLATLGAGVSTWSSALPVVLFFLTLLLGVSWYVSGEYELSLLARYYDKHAPRRPFVALPLVIFVATTIVVLSYYADKILVYSSIYAAYLLFAVSSGWLTCQYVLKAVREGEKDASIPEDFHDEIYLYYVLRPGPILGFLCGAVTFAAIACAAVSKVNHEEASRLETASYILIIGAILLGETVVWLWRRRLYTHTREA